jgi:uncharacterized RDD family membrane protein YckC
MAAMADNDPAISDPGAIPPAAPPATPPPAYPYASWGEPRGPSSYGLPGPEPGLQWGGVGARFGALLVDSVIIVAALFAVGFAISAVEPADAGARYSTAATAMSLAWVVFALVYHPVCWYLFGASLGQKALGLRIARAWSGAPIGIGEVLVRYLIFFFVTIAIPVGIVCAVMTSQDPFKRAWHDQVARTIVVRRM